MCVALPGSEITIQEASGIMFDTSCVLNPKSSFNILYCFAGAKARSYHASFLDQGSVAYTVGAPKNLGINGYFQSEV